jgi:hypothetical protein
MSDIKVRCGLTSSGAFHTLVDLTPGRQRARRPGEIIVFARCRNETLRLPAFLDHYRTLGANRFVVVDNASTDGTTDYLVAQPDVLTFRTTDAYAEADGGTAWLNALLAECGSGGWCVTVDIDELFVYPGSENTPLPVFTSHLERTGCDAVLAVLLDLYPAGAVRDCTYASGGDLVRAAPHFDSSPYVRTPVEVSPGEHIRGGMRERVFYPELRARSRLRASWDRAVDRVSHMPGLRRSSRLRSLRRGDGPCLTKVPLVRWDAASAYLASNHWISPKAVAQESGALLHFKFLGDLPRRAIEEAARGQYYENAAAYRRYAAILAERPELSLMYPGSARYAGSRQLVELGLIRDTPAWAAARGQAFRPA